MAVIFKGEYVSFQIRLIKKVASILPILIIVFLKINYDDSNMIFAGYQNYLNLFLVACFFFGMYYHVRDIRTVVTEVTFSEDKLQVSGYDLNRKFEDTLAVNHTFIEIKSRSKSHLYIEIFADGKYFYINNYSRWENTVMSELLQEYRRRCDNKITGHSFPGLL
ncbi:hypothetical protein HYN48_09850 [Flavobacterium magnum]|uniref:Uncharacterized protein n=1 Tax=Flavobacterium magnum TaxID=2162713 RepID=A0A2S0REJ6_9FLAO|nr:hypothetical protein [Flavobacterium magnum]AWA30367.1 hypothetical protein HYN48_09850 [Flavobacterium magnum]